MESKMNFIQPKTENQLKIENLLTKISEMDSKNVDFSAPTNELFISTEDNKTHIICESKKGEPTRFLKVNDLCLEQICKTTKLGKDEEDENDTKNYLPVKTGRLLRSNFPKIFDKLVNQVWLEKPKQKMLRCVDDLQAENHLTARAFLSNNFKRFDNLDLLNASLETILNSNADWQLQNYSLTDRRFYLNLRSANQVGDGANVGDVMANGLLISNSEIGMGSILVRQLIWTLACLNGLQTQNEDKKAHLTSAQSNSDLMNILSDKAKDLDNQLLAETLRNIIAKYASDETFNEVREKFKRADQDVIEGEYSVTKVSENLNSFLALPKKNVESITEGLFKTLQQSGYNDGRMTRATMVNAVTSIANTVSPDDAEDWQVNGNKVLNMNNSDWQKISKNSFKEVA